MTQPGPTDPEPVAPAVATGGSAPAQGWSPPGGPPTTLILVRHGVTAHTVSKRFSGGLTGANPGLSEDGRDQVRLAGEWLRPIGERIAAVVASPVRRTRESADILAGLLSAPLVEEAGFAETDFGVWEGLTYAEVAERFPGELADWHSSMEAAPPGGESFADVRRRVLAGLDTVLATYAGRRVVVLSHVTPIKILVAQALGAPLSTLFTMELSPASVSVVSFYPDPDSPEPRGSLRLFNGLPPGQDAFSADPTRW